MSYEEQAELLLESRWRARCDACTREQAGIFVNDERPEYVGLAKAVISQPQGSPVYAVAAQVVARPGMSTESTDADLLSAVQYVWPAVGVAFVDGSSSA